MPRHLGWRLGMRCALVALSVAGARASGWANPLNFGGMFAGKWESINEAAISGQWETYFTGYAWHLPYGYREATRARLNETTWGGGFGRTIRDEDGDRHSIYMMSFADSHREPQFNLGYAWQRYFPVTRDLSVGAGYLAFLFSREDVANYLPIPAALPCASISFRGIEVIGLFVPKVSRDIKGDVLFVYLRMPIGPERATAKRALSRPARGARR